MKFNEKLEQLTKKYLIKCFKKKDKEQNVPIIVNKSFLIFKLILILIFF